jgi:hypothetical protein
VELSHGSGTCLSQESKGSGTLSGSKAETNDAASTSRSKSIQPNNLDLAFEPLILFKPGPIKAPFGPTNICQRKNKRRWNIPFIFQQKQLVLVVNV